MRKVFLILCIVVIIVLMLNQYNNPQYEDHSLFPTQDIINIYNEGFGEDVFEVGSFDHDNLFLNMSKTYYSPLFHSLLKGYDDGNYGLEISDFGNEKGDIVTNSEFKFYNDAGKAWFFADSKNLDEKYTFYSSIVVGNTKIKTPIKINIYDGNNYVFGYIRCVYKNTLYKEEKIYYIPLTEQSFGYSVDFDSKIKGYRMEHFGIFVVFNENTRDISLEIETNKGQFKFDVELSEAMKLDSKTE